MVESGAGGSPKPAASIEADSRFRVPPAADPVTDFFWTAGADGLLRFLRCAGCGYWLHPPGPRCPQCGSYDLSPAPVSGRAIVHSFTINHQPWDGDPAPYVVALVEMVEQVGLRLTTNLVCVDPGDVAVGQRVRVVFEHRHYAGRGDVWFPLFAPEDPDPAKFGAANPGGALHAPNLGEGGGS